MQVQNAPLRRLGRESGIIETHETKGGRREKGQRKKERKEKEKEKGGRVVRGERQREPRTTKGKQNKTKKKNK